MDLNYYYPRQVGELFFLVNTRDNKFLKVNEVVFDLVSAFKGVNGRCDQELVRAKYGLTAQDHNKYLANIVKALHDA